MTTIMRGWIPVVVALAGATCQRTPDRALAPDVLARHDSQFQALRDSLQHFVVASQRARRAVLLRTPTVVAFYPGVADTAGFSVDTLVLPAVAPFRRRLERYRVACVKAGYSFEVRDSRGVNVVDPRAFALHAASSQVAADSVGLLVGIPGEPLRVWYGLQLEATLPARLKALLPGARVKPRVGT
jgi:hypothetical protein